MRSTEFGTQNGTHKMGHTEWNTHNVTHTIGGDTDDTVREVTQLGT